MGGGCGQGMCTLNPRGRLAVGPRTTLKEIPLYEIPGAVHPKPVLVCVRVCVRASVSAFAHGPHGLCIAIVFNWYGPPGLPSCMA